MLGQFPLVYYGIGKYLISTKNIKGVVGGSGNSLNLDNLDGFLVAVIFFSVL